VPHDEYGPIAELYDHVIPYRALTDVSFYVDAARESGGPVLELGCGSGRVLLPTARAGIEITGLDLSPAMIGICRQKIAAEPTDVRQRVQLVEGSMTAFDLGRTFRLITIPFRPFQHLLTVDDQLACLACIRRHLAADGRLVFDIFNPSLDALVNRPIGVELDPEPEFTTPDGRRVIRCHKIVAQDRFRQVGTFELIYDVTHPNGHTERLIHAFEMRYLFRFEAEHLLARAGFQIEHIYAGADKSEYGCRYPGELFFVARLFL
jgi:SAM-dependent methyltransferase